VDTCVRVQMSNNTIILLLLSHTLVFLVGWIFGLRRAFTWIRTELTWWGGSEFAERFFKDAQEREQ